MEIHKELEDRDIRRGMIKPIGTVTQVSIRLRKTKKGNKKMVVNIKMTQTYEYGDKCVRICKGREIRMHVSSGNYACIYMSDKIASICHQDLKRHIYVA